MTPPFDILSESCLETIILRILELVPSARIAFLSSLGKRIHESAARVLFHTLIVQDDEQTLLPSVNTSSAAVIANPRRYAKHVKKLIVRDSDALMRTANIVTLPKDESSSSTCTPLSTTCLETLLKLYSNLEALCWEGCLQPPDGLCEILVGCNPRLRSFSYDPPALPLPQRKNLIKWDAPSLPLLADLPITTLRLSWLSQTGTRTFTSLLQDLGEHSTLEDLSVDFVWLDDPLCEAIAANGRKLRRLRLSTSGTKLTDKGIIAILEGCDALEDLLLDQIQGRLSRALWSKPTGFPKLRRLHITISESGPSHSWTTDHLMSLEYLPTAGLSEMSVTRTEAPPRIYNDVPMYDPTVDDTVSLQPLPAAMQRLFREAKSFTILQCDFWMFSITDIKMILDGCPRLESVQFCLDAPFSKLLTLTSIFANLSNLNQLRVSVNHVHAPGKPPVPLPPHGPPSLPTPTDSPVLKSKAVLPQLLDFDQMQNQTCLAKADLSDPSMPLLRDIKRFVRKCPKLETLEWYGKFGRGSWIVKRAVKSKISMNVSVEYRPPKISDSVWAMMTREQEFEMSNMRWIETVRRGQEWTGEKAELLAKERQVNNMDASACDGADGRSGRNRGRPKKIRASSISTSSSNSDLTPLTPKLSDGFPVQMFSPLTPPHSDFLKRLAPLHRERDDTEVRPPHQAKIPALGKESPSTRATGQEGGVAGEMRTLPGYLPRKDKDLEEVKGARIPGHLQHAVEGKKEDYDVKAKFQWRCIANG
ncbi:uncharacterized protein BT62DRAFT_1005681 [Guyanagaster necrorhizus]|uniref:Uncharacterized protein n=1 Tax=Guyanagaster necrorhizus TaxID=856835 RepID=A0A9P8ASJ8_9AGAR|nr:uncharacterized protein BT62DRAFT_1005681 [Guyanagaster necrorhizus MCA 3950]KAG7446404.1 hypothetical protein BT62DRAFT_1005681 [Guyanagaster necrorhizus MCA 3950]